MSASSRSIRRTAPLAAVLAMVGALGLAQQAMADGAAPAPFPPDRAAPPPIVDVPLRAHSVSLADGRLAIALNCSRAGSVKVSLSGRRFATASFDCENGSAVARTAVRGKLAGRLRGARVEISARSSGKVVTRTLRVSAPGARAAAYTFTLNGPVYNYMGPTDYRGYLRFTSGWYPANTTTRVLKWQVTTSELASGTIEDYYYYSATQGWFMYRKRECGSGGSACWWTWVHPSFNY